MKQLQSIYSFVRIASSRPQVLAVVNMTPQVHQIFVLVYLTLVLASYRYSDESQYWQALGVR